jgi:ribose transport system permease protein
MSALPSTSPVIGIPSFIMTLAMMQIAAGISKLLVRGQIACKVPDLVTTLGSSSIGGVPWIVIVAALMLLGGHLVLTYTLFGRYIYMVGGNREAAEYSGLNVKLILGSVMVISAICSGIGGMPGVAQNEFDTYLLDSIAVSMRRGGGTGLSNRPLLQQRIQSRSRKFDPMSAFFLIGS